MGQHLDQGALDPMALNMKKPKVTKPMWAIDE